MKDKYMLLYESNKEFHDYVDRLRRPGKKDAGVELEEILARKTVKDVGDYYESKPTSEKQSPVSPYSPNQNNNICDCDDKSC